MGVSTSSTRGTGGAGSEGKNYKDLYGNPDNKHSKRYLHAKVLNKKAVLYFPGVFLAFCEVIRQI